MNKKHFRSLPWLGLLNSALHRLPLIRDRAERDFWISEVYERFVTQNLGNPDLFNGWCTAALRSMRKAKSLGALTVLNTGSSHIAYQRDLLEEEYSKFGLQRTVTDPRIVEKGTQEFIEADHIIVASSFVRQTLLDKGINSYKISIVPDAVTRTFDIQPKKDDVFRIIFVGRLELRKGVQYLLEAFNQLQLSNSELLLVGGPQPEIYPLLRKYEGLYRLTGRISDSELGWHFSQSSVFVLPSVEDGWGHVTLEAMSCGLPAIVSTHAGSADAIHEGINGFTVPPCDDESIAEKLDFLYENQDIAIEMGKNAKSMVQRRTWDEYGQQMMSVFNMVLHNRESPFTK